MTSLPEKGPLLDFETEADLAIDKYFAEKGVVKDVIELSEKKFIIKELAIANKKSEIVPKLNSQRRTLGLPEINPDFDIQYYAKEYAPIIEDISLHYAKNLAKKYRFANRITRISKLNELAESILNRIHTREGEDVMAVGDKEEKLHNENIKLFTQLVNAIDEQMGKLKLTKIDVNVRQGDEKAQLETPEAIREAVKEAIQRYRPQLPGSVDANFKDVTEYEKCSFGEEWTNQVYCQYHGSQCKVQADEVSICPFFLNKILLANREYMARRYIKDNLSLKQIAEIAGCKEINEKVLERVRTRLRDYGIARDTSKSG